MMKKPNFRHIDCTATESQRQEKAHAACPGSETGRKEQHEGGMVRATRGQVEGKILGDELNILNPIYR